MGSNPNIQHIVVLMMENRSFDHLLGYLMTENIAIDGIADNLYSNPGADGEPHCTVSGAAYQGQLILDPGHDVDDVYLQMYGVPFGTAAGDPTMSGFAQSYQQLGGDPQDVMLCFKPEQVPNIAALARSYAVCDRWFSSVPGPTLPNRAFAHFGTSFGRADMSPLYTHEGLFVDTDQRLQMISRHQRQSIFLQPPGRHRHRPLSSRREGGSRHDVGERAVGGRRHVGRQSDAVLPAAHTRRHGHQ